MEPILGIDLGTTNSEVAIIRDGKAVACWTSGQAILPSVVGLDVGAVAGRPGGPQPGLVAPERTVRSIKRKMGEDDHRLLGDREFTPQEISAIILRTLKERAERVLGHRSARR